MNNLMPIPAARLALPDEAIGTFGPRRRIAWRDIAWMRDRQVHHYDAVDMTLVWESAINDEPAPLELVERISPPARY